MKTGLLDRLLKMFCQHEFSWPRIGSDGQDYQVCLHCGRAFLYDWELMQRTGPLVPYTKSEK
jgi:hypothetical protein